MEQRTIDALEWMIGIFNKYKIEYQIAGGFAAKLYGSPRPLNDIDFDISEKNFSTILPDISGYITFGPSRLNDGKWDCELITLNYRGQEIDLCGVDSILMSNKERTKWIPYPNQSLNSLDIKAEGFTLKVIHPRDLATYKKELDGEHQMVDIQAIEEYLVANSL